MKKAIIFDNDGVLVNTEPLYFQATREMCAKLAKDFRVIAPDELGFGLTDMPPKPDYSLTARAEHVLALLSDLKIHSASICGQSQGAWIASYIALKHPKTVMKLILVNSGSITMAHRETSTSTRSPSTFPTKENVKQFLLRYIYRSDLLTDDMADTALEYAKRNYQVHELTLGSPQQSRENTSIGGQHISEFIHQIKVPTLIIWGNLDAVPLDRGIWLFNTIEGSQLHLFNDSKHMPFIDHHEEFNRIVSMFCKG